MTRVVRAAGRRGSMAELVASGATTATAVGDTRSERRFSLYCRQLQNILHTESDGDFVSARGRGAVAGDVVVGRRASGARRAAAVAGSVAAVDECR